MSPSSNPKSGTRGIKRVDLAYVAVATSESVRDVNRDIILELVRVRQSVARADLSRLSGLQPSTVSAIVDQLIKEGWITEGAVARRPRGRRPTMLSLNDELVILVADLRPKQATVAVVDLNGRFLARQQLPIGAEPERAIDKMIECMQDMREAHANKCFEGIGISMPGRVDPESQRLILAPNLKWSDYDVKEVIQKRMQLQVELDNAANACLLSELWSGRLDGIRNAVLITLSEGLGAAILANGQIVVGRNGLAGEFGHISVDPAGPMCSCGQRGCWEVFASSSAAVRFYEESAPRRGIRGIQELMQLAEEDDSTAMAAISKQAGHLGRGLRLLTAALSPELILITGDLTSSWNRFGPIVQAELDAGMLSGTAPRLAITTDGELARLRGAAAVVLQRHSGRPRLIPLAEAAKGIRRKAALVANA